MLYKQLLRAQIPKAQKIQSSCLSFVGFQDLRAKAARRTLMKLSRGVDPTKLFFFDNEEFFHFSLVSLRFYYIQKKIID